MTKFVSDGTAWKEVRSPGYHLNVDGTAAMKQVDKAWVSDGTSWRLYYTKAAPVVLAAASTHWYRVAVSWNSIAAGGTYVLKRDGAVVYSGSATSYTDASGLMPATTYTYTIEASLGGVVQSTDSEPATTRVYSDPGLVGSSSRWDIASLSWTDPDQGQVDYYHLYRNGAIIYEGPASAGKSFNDSGLNPSTSYTYELYCWRLPGTLIKTDTRSINTPAHGDLGVTYSELSHNYVLITWSDTTQGSIDQYDVYLNSNFIETSWGTDHAAGIGIAASTAYTAMVVAYRAGVEIGPRGYVSFSSPGTPTVADHFQIGIYNAASYNGSGGNRGTSELYYGWYSSNHGDQKSQVQFDIPANARNCISWDNFQVRWWNIHHFWASGGTVNMVIHHNQNLSGNYGGSTGHLTGSNGSAHYWPGPRNSWINGTEWFHLNDSYTPGRSTAREEFRTLGAHGLGLDSLYRGPSQDGYGYAARDPLIDVWYTRYA